MHDVPHTSSTTGATSGPARAHDSVVADSLGGGDAAGVDGATGAVSLQAPVGRTGVLSGRLQGIVDSFSTIQQLVDELDARIHAQARAGTSSADADAAHDA